MSVDPFAAYLDAKYYSKIVEAEHFAKSELARSALSYYLYSYCFSDMFRIIQTECKDNDEWSRVTDANDFERFILGNSLRFPVMICRLKELFSSHCRKVISVDIDKKFKKEVSRFKTLKELFLLSEPEIQLIEFYYFKETSSFFDRLGGDNLNESILKAGKRLSRILKIPLHTLKKSFSKKGNLFKSFLFEENNIQNTPRLNDYTFSYLSGIESSPVSTEYLYKEKLSDAFSLCDFSLSKTDLQSIKMLYQMKSSGAKLLLYGKPGTGKTEFAKTLAKELGRELYIIQSSDEYGNDSLRDRQRAVIASQKIFKNSNILILVDESDAILNSQNTFFMCEKNSNSDTKAWINAVLEDDSVDMIWISNYTHGIDESTKRRFNYSIEFDDLTLSQRKRIWEKSQEKFPRLFSKEEIEELASHHTVNAGSVGLAYKSASKLPAGTNKEEKRQFVKAIVSNHQKFIKGDRDASLSVSNFYDPRVVSTDIPVEQIIETVSDFYRYQEENWGEAHSFVSNINLLFSGPSGTGKTEFAKYVAKSLEKKLMQMNGSDLFDKYVGETEKKIARMFKQAEREGAILFLDEADSLFTAREAATASWQVSWTNELLVQMEKFKGVLICSTNFVENLDHASMRRFNMKVRFDVLSDQGKVILFNSMLAALTKRKISSSEEEKLRTIVGLTVGDYKTVYQRNYFIKGQSNLKLINDLKLEVSYKSKNLRRIGL